MNRKLCILGALLTIGIPAAAQRPIWSKQGTVFDLFRGKEGAAHLRSKRAYSPDHTKYLEFSWSMFEGSPVPDLILVDGAQKIDVPFIIGWVQMEAVWSPDSMSFSLTGNDSGTTNATEIFRISDGTLQPVSLMPLYQDMARTYSPCRAARQVLGDCRQSADGTDFNYATVAWSSSTTAVVMAEVPCSSLWGGIMCEVEAYELDVTDQKITARISALEFKRKWQPFLAWRFQLPDPPEWESADRTAQ